MSDADNQAAKELQALPLDTAVLLRLSTPLKDILLRQAAHYSVAHGRPVPFNEYLRAVLTAHATHSACPCEPHCAGG